MKIRKSAIGIVVLFIGMVGVCVSGWAEDDGPKQLIVKGLYVGMDINEAKDICKKYLDKTMTLEEFTPEITGIYQEGVGSGVLLADSKNKLKMIALGRPVVDNMFNAHGIPIEDFAQQFVAAYDIPSMTAFREKGDSGWRFTSPYGYKVEILTIGQLSIERIAKKDYLKFD